MKRQLRCGGYIESQYYNQKYGVKANMIVTEDIYETCYEDEYIVSTEEICDKCDVGGRKQLLLCRYCFDMNIEITCSSGSTKHKQKKYQ